jgi:hypothetical protein
MIGRRHFQRQWRLERMLCFQTGPFAPGSFFRVALLKIGHEARWKWTFSGVLPLKKLLVREMARHEKYHKFPIRIVFDGIVPAEKVT